MTDPIAPSDQLLSLDELPSVPDVALRGPGRLASEASTTAAVDGVAVIFFDPTTQSPHLVFVSEGLATLLGSGVDELLGHSPAVIFPEDEAAIELEELRRTLGIGDPAAAPTPISAAPSVPAATPPAVTGELDPTETPSPTPPTTPTIDLDALEPGGPTPSPPNFPVADGSSETNGSGWADGPAGFDGSPGADGQPTTELDLAKSPVVDLDALADAAALSDLNSDPNADPNSDPDATRADGAAGRSGRRSLDAAFGGDIDDPGAFDGDHFDDGDDFGGEPGSASRRHATTQTLRRRDGDSVLVHATYTTVPSMTPVAPYVVVQYRDLGKAAAESLLADQAAVIGSLSRGHELGRLCHQVAAQVESDVGDGSRCWIGVVNADDLLEPVISGDLPFDAVADIMRTVAGSGSDATKRVVAVDGMPEHHARLLQGQAVKALWYVPMVGTGGKVRGALMVATPIDRPDRAITRSLDHLGAVMAAAVEHATAEADIAHQSLHDPLTHLPNRALIVDRLGQALARLERDGIALSVLLVDIDRFRSVNDTRGVEVGDQVLLEVAARLLTAVRLGDTVGRVSSDQYLIMCVATSGELDAAAVGRRILRSLSEPIAVADGDQLHITASVGVVVVDEPGPSPAVIISNAESALARASSGGRGQMAMFEADLRRHVVDRHETEQALHRAITHEELRIHYQPLVEIRTGFMVGAEALVRWDRPDHGLLYPPSFIQIAEESELILPMGNWIIDKVCSDLGRWPKSNGRSPMVTINLAARQLAVDTLVPTVVSALQRNGLHPSRVGFEITESMEIRDLDAASVNLNRLSELGCRIAIDDFGIGHATLAYIRQFSMADALKIDRSFVAGLGSSKEDTAIVNASIALAESLELQVIAEGVENVEQLTGLQDLGCRYAQGFGLARPMPFDDVLELWSKARLYEPLRL